ncbi:hypothetical protein ACLOJK_032156 [Asimina triloba]
MYSLPPIQAAMGRVKLNVAIACLVPLPSIAFYLIFLRQQTSPSYSLLGHLWKWCSNHPLFLSNLLLLFNVDILFWVISLIQSSNWLIDLYWTVIPVMLVHYYASHPYARSNALRSVAVILLTWVWSLRLTHSYLRRERWELGAREDWRFSDLRNQYGKSWWWVSFFAAYLIQQSLAPSHPALGLGLLFDLLLSGLDHRGNIFMRIKESLMHVWVNARIEIMSISEGGGFVLLVGLCLPMYAIHLNDKPWNLLDTIAAAVCVGGIAIAYVADAQLFRFGQTNKILRELGMPTMLHLNKGLWKYSRHPNYFGEQLWWWGLVIFGWNVSHGWTFIGSLLNSLCLAYVTTLVEKRMLREESRAEAYRQYQKTTSVWIPWFNSSPRFSKEKSG